MVKHNPNPEGCNQHAPTAKSDDPRLVEALHRYHREKLTDNNKISERLKAEHGIVMSARTVRRRRKELGLQFSGAAMKELPRDYAKQLVVSQLDKDPARRKGKHTIQQLVAFDEGVHLTRAFVSDIMHEVDPEGFALREPTAKKIQRFPKVPIGIHERWSADGHDKLYRIGFPIWAIADDATGKWLDAWVVPSNRMGHIVAYLFLCAVEKYGGIPLQFTTDCGSETTKAYGLMNALRSIFAEDIDLDELPAHVYLRSIHNITIERSWLRLRIDFGDNAVYFFEKGAIEGKFDSTNPQHVLLSRWLWPMLLQKELQRFMDFRNGARMRKDTSKAGPSGCSRNDAFALPEKWGGRDCLIPVDVDVIREMKAAMGGDTIIAFVEPDFASRAQAAFDELHILDLNFENVWEAFVQMYPLCFPIDMS